MKNEPTEEKRAMDGLLRFIKTWINTKSGPTQMTISMPAIKVRVKFRGYKKIILERTLHE